MQTQFSLPGFDPDPRDPYSPPKYGLFLGLFPAPEDATRIARNVDRLPRQLGVVGTRLETSRLHVTLHDLGEFVEVPQSLIDRTLVAVSAVACPPVEVVFDHAMSFSGNGAFVLCGQENTGIDVLRQRLAMALKRAGLRHHPSSKPHMTLLYDRGSKITKHNLDPILWTASEFVLVLSHLGETYHQWLARWPLAGTS